MLHEAEQASSIQSWCPPPSLVRRQNSTQSAQAEEGESLDETSSSMSSRGDFSSSSFGRSLISSDSSGAQQQGPQQQQGPRTRGIDFERVYPFVNGDLNRVDGTILCLPLMYHAQAQIFYNRAKSLSTAEYVSRCVSLCVFDLKNLTNSQPWGLGLSEWNRGKCSSLRLNE